MGRYSDDWKKISEQIKTKADWKCSKCGIQCLRPTDIRKGLTKSEKAKLTLTVHHRNYEPEDNSQNNLVALCSGCHLSYHVRRRGNVCIGQLSLQLY